MATGCLSVPKAPDIVGIDRFAGPTYLTSRWPHEGVDFTGKRVASSAPARRRSSRSR
jgi:cation diffusion facilitator CzcD-associated flavoprotein CzcO